jgi:DNA uptake protein ComE-like DNA-binding protein
MNASLLATLTVLAWLTSRSDGSDRRPADLRPATIVSIADTAKKKTEKVNINGATREQLAAIAVIGNSYADKIIAGRPYQKKSELVTKKIIPDSVYAKVKNLLTVKAPKK